jgi:hypothetical protein
MLLKCRVARTLNGLMGTSKFDAWNIATIPSEDLAEIQLSIQWLNDLRDNV